MKARLAYVVFTRFDAIVVVYCTASEVASANPRAASGDSVSVTAPSIASLDAAPTNTGDSSNRGAISFRCAYTF